MPSMGPSIGLAKLGCTLHVVPPGKRAFPFHAHHVIEELEESRRRGRHQNADFKTATFVQIARTGESIDCWDDEAS